MDYLQFLHWHYIQLWTIIISGDEAIYHQWMISLDVIITMLLSINGTLTCYIPVMSTTQFLHPMSPSSMSVYTSHNASLQSTYLIMLVLLVTIFFLWHTCMSCHVMSCYVMVLCHVMACYRIWWHVIVLYAIICMYLGSNSYSVHCSTKSLNSWCPFGAPFSSSIAVSLLCCLLLLIIIITFYIYCFLKHLYNYIYSTVARAS